MKVALIAEWPNCGTDHVMHTIQETIAPKGIEADIFNVHKLDEVDLTKYDVVHFGFYDYCRALKANNYPAVITANVWHMSFANETDKAILDKYNIDQLIVDDVMTLQQLGLLGFTNVTKIPMPINPNKFPHLEEPNTEFTVGVFCNNYWYKNPEKVISAAKLAGIACHATVMDENRTSYNLDPIKDIYSKVHILASGTFVDTNSLPLREALLCGRPVLSTQSDGMGRVLRDGVNGYWYNGSITDLAEKMLLCKENYTMLAEGARNTVFESVDDIANSYINMWEKIVQ